MLPIPGTLSIDHLRENLAALEIELGDAEFDALGSHRRRTAAEVGTPRVRRERHPSADAPRATAEAARLGGSRP